LFAAGDIDAAAPLYGEMLDLYRSSETTPPLEMANALRSAALYAERRCDVAEARKLWIEARSYYQQLDERFALLRGLPGNPGVMQADQHLEALSRATP
jgi:hypothetical protein